MAASFEVSQSERVIAKQGVEMQAAAHGIDLTDPKVRAFVDHVIDCSATDMAAIRFYTNCLNKSLTK
jgi:hypothetical protein